MELVTIVRNEGHSVDWVRRRPKHSDPHRSPSFVGRQSTRRVIIVIAADADSFFRWEIRTTCLWDNVSQR